MADQYFKHVVPGKSPRSQKDNAEQIEWLFKFFDNPPAPMDKIEPKHIRQYMDRRVDQSKKLALSKNMSITPKTGQVRANREKALFSHIWNFSRQYGYTKLENPCAGIPSFREQGRDIYINDSLYECVYNQASKPLQFAMRLAYLTGQRPSDLLKITEMNIYDGYLHIKQNKTSNKLRFVLGGDLLNLINEIKSFKFNLGNNIYSSNLLVNGSGKTFTKIMLKYHFSKARDLANVKYNEFQFKDIRAKSATETDEISGIEKAQNLLGHSTQSMTAHYVRNKSGKIVQPLELRNSSAKSKKA